MKTLLYFLRPYRRLCLVTFLVMLLDVAGALYIPTLVAAMINSGVADGNMEVIFEKGGLMLGCALISGAATVFGCKLCAKLSARLGRDLRNALYDKSLTFSVTDFEEFGTGSMITRTLSDVSVVQQAFVWSVQMILPVPLMCIIGVLMAFSIDHVAGSLLIGVTALVMAVAVFLTRKASVIFEAVQRLLDTINRLLRENITGVRVIRAFNKEDREEARLRHAFEQYATASIEACTLFFVLDSLAVFFLNICIVAILWIGGNRIGLGLMEIGDITALTEYSVLILYYVIMAQMVIMLLPRAHVCLKRIDAVLAKTPELAATTTALEKLDTVADVQKRDTEGPMEIPSTAVARVAEKTDSAEVCRFADATFRFSDADEATLSGLSFAMRRGETTAIIGSTGSGKSTIAKLLLRFHDVSSGALLFGGRDVREMTEEALRGRIAYVPQKAWLFSGSIADNLRYGQPEASEEAIWHALNVAQADFVKALPEGLNSRVSQGGTNFSGGQKQRLAIARALMRKAELYIFDDSFSALDFRTDAALRKALSAEVRDSAVLIIAQRVSTIAHADQIIVLENGQIVGIGRHEVLLKHCAVYRDIAESQQRGKEMAVQAGEEQHG